MPSPELAARGCDWSKANYVMKPNAGQSIDQLLITLNLTEQCNLECVYCYQRERRDSKKNSMRIEVAKSNIDQILAERPGYEKALIEFIGGEPFMYWEKLRDIVEWAIENQSRWPQRIRFFADTNGTLLNDEIKNWLTRRRHQVIVGLSLDGTPEAHNRNRSNSYQRVARNIPFFARTWPEQTAKMTIGPATVDSVFEGVLHIMKNGMRVSANVPLESIWGSPDEKMRCVKAFQREVEKLVQFFGLHAELPLPSLIDLPLNGLFMSKEGFHPWCGSGRHMIAIDRQGNRLPCSRFDSMSFDYTLFGRPKAPIESSCYRCPFRNVCQTCEAHNWEVNGNPLSRTNFHCEFTKIQIWGTAQAQFKRLSPVLNDFMGRIQQLSDEEFAAFEALSSKIRVAADALKMLEDGGCLTKDGRLAYAEKNLSLVDHEGAAQLSQ